MAESLNNFGEGIVRTERVYYNGTDALKEGYPLCYQFNVGTASVADKKRAWYVQQPSGTNMNYFAGWVLKDLRGKTDAAGEVIIAKPGSPCNVWFNASVTQGLTYVPTSGQWYYKYDGFSGAGRVRALQTVDRSTTAGVVYCQTETGPSCGGCEIVTCGSTGGATTVMVPGVTYFPAATCSSNATFTLADGTYLDQKKAFYLTGSITTSNIVGTVTTPQIIAGQATSGYDVWTASTAAHFLRAQWNGKAWELQGSVLA